MRLTCSEPVLSAIWVDSSCFFSLCSLNLTLISSWWSRPRLMVSSWACVTPSLPIWTMGLSVWACARSLRLCSGVRLMFAVGCFALG